MRNGNFESPGLAPASFVAQPDGWFNTQGEAASAGAVVQYNNPYFNTPVFFTIPTPSEGRQTDFMVNAGGPSYLSQSPSLPAGNYGLSFTANLGHNA